MAEFDRPPFLIDHCPQIQLENPSKWTIQGYSKAGERTGLIIKPLKLVLDAGLGCLNKPAAILLTHSHYDHTLALPTLLSPRTIRLKGQESLCGRPVFMPHGIGSRVQKLMESVITLSDEEVPDQFESDYVWKRIGYHPFEVKCGEDFEVPGVGNLKVKALASYHNTPSIGYGLSTTKKKLKERYLKLTKEEIIAAKKKGEEITEIVESPEMVFYCDSMIENLAQHTEWRNYPVVLVECTGYPGIHTSQQMKERGHTHLEQLPPFIEKHREKQWVLLHSSCALRKEDLDGWERHLREKGLNIRILK